VGEVSNMRLPCPTQKIELAIISENSELKMNYSKIKN
jgi:hypothetical protein